jgi:hypothetical protein
MEWSSNFAYAIGLIASDGWLSKESGRIGFGSKEIEMMNNFKAALSLENKIGRHARGGEKEKKYFYINFRNKVFYDFLITIGITPAKSRTIKSVIVADEFFSDFLRGLFDGDGTFYSFWDTRWPNSFVYKIAFASASLEFILWLKENLTRLYYTHGYVHKGAGVYNLEYCKGDSRKLFNTMYQCSNALFLRRKYDKIKSAINKDFVLHHQRRIGLEPR